MMVRSGKPTKRERVPKKGTKSAASRFALHPSYGMVETMNLPPGVAERMRFEQATRSALHVYKPIVDAGQKSTQYASSIERKSVGPVISHKDLVNSTFPPFRMTKIGYGCNQYGRTNTSTDTTVGGDVRSIYIAPGFQAYQEYVGLPTYNVGLNDTFTTTLIQLIQKATDVTNTAVPLVSVASMTAPTFGENQKINRNIAFHYNGGYQSHKWVNSGSTEISLEFFEAKPNQRDTGLTDETAGATTWTGPGAYILQDLKNNEPRANALAPIYRSTDYDTMTDKLSHLSHMCLETLYRFQCTKPKTVTIPPGGEFNYKMSFKAFSFTESSWNSMINNTASDEESNQPNLMPAWTKILCVRYNTELGHSLESGTSVTSYAKVGYLPGMLMHTCTEHHDCNFMPVVFKQSTAMANYLDASTDVKAQINTLSGNQEEFQDDM